MNEGWICPRCGRVNAPFMPYCDCKVSVSDIIPNQCNHQWECYGVSTAGTHYRCAKCGQTKTEIYNPEHYVVTITT